MTMHRRTFLQGVIAAGGAVLFPVTAVGTAAAGTGAEAAGGTDILSWIVINPDNTITYRIPQTELGQAVTTTIPQMLAEELDATWETVRTEFYDPARSKSRGTPYGWTTTLGSSSAHYLFDASRTAAAQVRDMLMTIAAEKLETAKEELTTGNNTVSHAASGRSMTYAELAADAAKLEPPAAEAVAFRPAPERKFIGKPMPRVDIPAITRGEMEFGIDVEIDGMRHAAVRQSPVFGGTLKSADDSALDGLPGNPVIVRLQGGFVGYNSPVPDGEDPDLWAAPVNVNDAVAVVADSWWEAQQALDALTIEWDAGEWGGLSTGSLHDHLAGMVSGDLPVISESGDVDSGLSGAAKAVEADYVYPFQDHAQMEPLAATALVENGKTTLWAGSQYPDDAHRIAAELTGAGADNTKLHLMRCGGGFGRRLQNDFVHQAVQIAMAQPGVPVKLIWSREECIRRGTYMPYTLVRYKGGISEAGEVATWSCDIVSGQSAEQSYGGTHWPFFFENMRVRYQRDKSVPVPFGWFRGVGLTQHLWMNNGFLGELAAASGISVLSLYRQLLDSGTVPADLETRDLAIARLERLSRLLETAVEGAVFESTRAPGTGRGIAVTDTDYYPGYPSSTKSAVVDVTVNGASISVDKVAVFIDAGTVVNPDVVEAQLQGCVVMALNNAFLSEITLENGQVQQSNFDDYEMLLIDRIPEIEVNILPGEGLPLSVGEDAVPMTIAALVNAIADAGGPRVRSLPIKGLELV